MRRPWNQVDYSRCVVLEHQDASSLNTLRLRKMRRPWTLFRSKLLKDKTRERKPEKNGLIFFMLNYTTIKDVLNLEDASTISISIFLFFLEGGCIFTYSIDLSPELQFPSIYMYSLPLVWVVRYWRKKHFIPVEIDPVPMIVKKKSNILKKFKRTCDGPGVIRKTCLSFQLGWAIKIVHQRQLISMISFTDSYPSTTSINRNFSGLFGRARKTSDVAYKCPMHINDFV